MKLREMQILAGIRSMHPTVQEARDNALYITEADEPQGSKAFAELLQRMVDPKDRQFRVRPPGGMGEFGSVFATLINLPKGIGGDGGGAEAENNRMSFDIEGFDRKNPDAPPPKGKVKVSQTVNALGRQHQMRAKSGTPAQCAKYLADYVAKIVKEVPPKYTHTKDPGKKT